MNKFTYNFLISNSLQKLLPTCIYSLQNIDNLTKFGCIYEIVSYYFFAKNIILRI